MIDIETPSRNEGEIRISHAIFKDLLKSFLQLPESYTIWGVWDMKDYLSILVESDELPATRSGEPIPVVTPTYQRKNSTLKLVNITVDKEFYADTARGDTGESEAI